MMYGISIDWLLCYEDRINTILYCHSIKGIKMSLSKHVRLRKHWKTWKLNSIIHLKILFKNAVQKIREKENQKKENAVIIGNTEEENWDPFTLAKEAHE